MLQTLTHEFFHAIQFNFPLKAGCWHPAYAWFVEASATWSEEYVYPDAQSEQPYAPALLDATFNAIDLWEAGGQQEYAAYLLPYYFSRIAHAPGIVREAWVASKDEVDSVHAIGVALAGLNGWDAVWPEVTLYNWNREPVDDYRDVDDLEGLSLGFSMLIQDSDHYSLSMVIDGANKMLWLSKVTQYDTDGSPNREVKDVLGLSNQEPGLTLLPDGCRLNGVLDNEILAAGRNGVIILAWRANMTSDKFEVMATDGIECHSDKAMELE